MGKSRSFTKTARAAELRTKLRTRKIEKERVAINELLA